MSWDLFVADIPPLVHSADELPPDWEAPPILAREAIVSAIETLVPSADVPDPAWIRVDGPGFSVEVSIGANSPLTNFALHVRGGDGSLGFVAELLDRLQLRAFDPGSESGIFDPANASESLTRWRQYRAGVIDRASDSGN